MDHDPVAEVLADLLRGETEEPEWSLQVLARVGAWRLRDAGLVRPEGIEPPTAPV